MNQTIFETRHRAEELLNEAIAIWRQSARSERLEGLEKDPVFSMLMAAVAYQSNEIDTEIERLKSEVLEDYAAMLTPYELGHATPATTIIQTMPQDEYGEVEVDSNSIFRLNDGNFQFIPLLHTRVINAWIKQVKRIDGRRWMVDLAFNGPVTNLSLLTFSIQNTAFRDVHITIGDKEVPLIRPWEYSEMPWSEAFSPDNFLYNQGPSYDASTSIMELMARHGQRYYCVKPHKGSMFLPKEAHGVRMLFEFTGVQSGFRFDQTQLHLNVLLLANARISEAQLDMDNPIVRITDEEPVENMHDQLMHLLAPHGYELYGNDMVQVRKVMADRFNQGNLVRLLSTLLVKVQSDYYAFQYLKVKESQHALLHIREYLKKLFELANENLSRNITGTYLILKPEAESGLTIRYITTNGKAVNKYLNEQMRFTPPGGLAITHTWQITAPLPGSDEISTHSSAADMVRYAIATNNRIITPSDIRLFCIGQLRLRYGIMREMITGFTVKQQPLSPDTFTPFNSGYEIVAEITLINSTYVKRNFVSVIPQTEIMLEKMMEVRSTQIYPIRVHIRIQEDE